ncbi:MFS transporter [Natrialba asiatica]|uniref:Major facilitator superfamily protein n=1 Tax=Natrialba asiatica (strain ATCC 700177 / DSM 12278 / JCM 9576 / FERM P-10747 / NBRC 102637 / 172P1) TaxID=29540 RepID=M0AWT0_NATA1|nr:MFS transporter [Natrialba asiatica]ELZ02428.1 major facilitator superfamily protein [Natrialba asiatica DSM 12278]
MSADETTIPWRSPTLQAILVSTLVLPLGVPLLSPVLPAIRDSFGITDARTSLLITAYFVPGIVLSPVIGMLADQVGRKRVMVPSLLAFGVTGVLAALVNSFSIVLALRLLQGTASAGVFILTVTFISDVFDGVRRNAVLGVNAAALFAGAAIYPFVGGALGSIDWHVPFLVYAVAIPAGLFAMRALEEPPTGEPRTGLRYLRGAVDALPAGEASALYGATFLLEAVAFGTILTALPFVLTADFDASSVVIGAVLTIQTIASAAVALKNGDLAKRWSNHRLVACSFLCYGIGLLVVWAGQSVPVLTVGAVIVGVGFGLALPSIDAAIGRIALPEYRAGALSIRNATTFLGRSAGPVVYTGLTVLASYAALLALSGIAMLLLGIGAFLVTSSEPRVRSSESPRSQ